MSVTLTIPAAVQWPRKGTIRVAVLHDPGQPDVTKGVSAKGVAEFCALPPEKRNPKGSGGYHALTDSRYHLLRGRGTLVIAAPDDHKVAGAKGANEDGVHLCFGDYGPESLALAAKVVGGWCDKYRLPRVWLEPDQFNAGAWGIITHANVEIAIRAEGPHTDPRLFPRDEFMRLLGPIPLPEPAPEDHELMLIYAPDRQQTQGPGQSAYLNLDIAARQIVGHNGARLAEPGGQPAKDKDGFVLKLPGEPTSWGHPRKNGVVDYETILVPIKGSSDEPLHFHFA